MRVFHSFLLMALICWGCGSSGRLSKYYSEEDKAVLELIEGLEKNPTDKNLIRQVGDAYDAAFLTRLRKSDASVTGSQTGDQLMVTAKEWEVLQLMYSRIRKIPDIDRKLPYLQDPLPRLEQVRQQAAEQYYNAGRTYLSYNTRQHAQTAVDLFEKANKAWPGYKDVNSLLELANEKAITRVLVNPVNYYRYSYSYWGFQNDWLQQQMVRDLNARAFRNVRFFTEYELRAQRLVPDKIVELDFVDLFVDRVHSENRRYERTKRIQTGQTGKPPRPIYTTVRATVQVQRQYMASYATLECRIYDRETGQNSFYDRFSDRLNWTQQRASFTGDRRALTPEDIAMLSNQWSATPPSREQIADQLIRNVYQQLLSRINSGVSF